MKTASAIIDKLGGTSAVASVLNRTPSTISSWRGANYIPEWWRGQLLDAAKKRGITISAAEFPSLEDRISRGHNKKNSNVT